MADALTKIAAYYRTNQPEIATRVLEARKRTGSAVARSAASLDGDLLDSVSHFSVAVKRELHGRTPTGASNNAA